MCCRTVPERRLGGGFAEPAGEIDHDCRCEGCARNGGALRLWAALNALLESVGNPGAEYEAMVLDNARDALAEYDWLQPGDGGDAQPAAMAVDGAGEVREQ